MEMKHSNIKTDNNFSMSCEWLSLYWQTLFCCFYFLYYWWQSWSNLEPWECQTSML